MPDTPEQEEAVTESGGAPQEAETRLRLWPAVIIVAAHLSVSLGAVLTATTNIHYAIGNFLAPVLAALLLVIWWLAASRVPLRDRLIGLVLAAAIVAWVALSQKSNGSLLLVVALPALTTTVVAFLA